MLTAIQVNELSKQYGDGTLNALDSLSLQIKKGRFFGLVGPNGAGKTTLINIIAGLVRRTAGELRIFGEEVREEDSFYRRFIGFVLDRPMYFTKLTVKEYLEFTAGMYDIDKQEAREKIDELVDFFDLEPVSSAYIETYSKGMKQKVSLAAAIIHEPELLILDEPFAGIDTTSAEEIRRLLLRMNEKGVTVLITSHILEMIESLCTECAIIHKGRVAFQSMMGEFEVQLQESGDNKTKASLKEIFLQITSDDRRHKSLSWLT